MCVLVLVLALASSSASTSANGSTSAGISLMCVLVRVPASVMRVLVQKILPVLIEVYQTLVLHLGASSRYLGVPSYQWEHVLCSVLLWSIEVPL